MRAYDDGLVLSYGTMIRTTEYAIGPCCECRGGVICVTHRDQNGVGHYMVLYEDGIFVWLLPIVTAIPWYAGQVEPFDWPLGDVLNNWTILP